MAKKTNIKNIPIWGWIIIALLVLLILNQRGIIDIDIPFIPGTIVEPPILKETSVGECRISLDKYLIDAGELVKGTIYNYPFANCEILVKIFGGIWTSIGSHQLDKNGELSYETPVNLPGTYEIIGICTSSEGSCKTNGEILTVGGTLGI